MENETYDIDLVCENCEEAETHEIEVGTTVRKYLESGGVVCENCGCKIKSFLPKGDEDE